MALVENETIRTWLSDLIDREIDEELGTISNERIWQKGSNNDLDIIMREDNIVLHEKYIEILKCIKKQYVGEKC